MMLVFVEYIECVENAHRLGYVRCMGPETTPGKKQRGVVFLESVRTRHRVRANSFPATQWSSSWAGARQLNVQTSSSHRYDKKLDGQCRWSVV
jgi:hypothetical protein